MQTTAGTLAEGRSTSVRGFTRADVDEWCQWPAHEDPLFRDYNSPHLSPVERDLWYAERVSRPDHAMYAVVDHRQRLVGRLFLRHIDRTDGSAVLGIDLRSDALGRGLGSDALPAFLGYYFGRMEMKRLRLDVAGYNYRAQRLYERSGFVYTGEHWSLYPFIFAPEVYSDPALAEFQKYFRRSNAGVSVLHYDMTLTCERWLEIKQHAG